MVVDQEHSNFSASNDQQQVDNESEPKHVIVLVHPQTSHDKEKFDVGSSKGHKTSNQHSTNGIQENRCGRDCPGDSGSYRWEFNGFLLVAKVSSQKDQRNGNAAPHGGEDDNIQEGSRGRGMHEKENNVEEKEKEESNSGEEYCGDDSTELPETATESLVETAAHKSRNNSTEHVEDQDSIHEGTTPSRAEKANSREDYREENRCSQLNTTSDANAVHHGHCLGRTEDIGVDELPTRLIDVLILFFVSKGRKGVIGRNITTQVADQDGNDQERQKEDNKDRVGDGVPMDLRGDQMIFRKVNIPTRRPSDITFVPNYVVSVNDGRASRGHLLILLNHTALHVGARDACIQRLSEALLAFTVPLVTTLELMCNTHGFHRETYNTVAFN